MPRTELPFSSRGGDQRPIPITLGMTKIRAPLTPDFAGKPTYIEIILDEVYYIPYTFVHTSNANSPE